MHIKDFVVSRATTDSDFVLVEIGGTVGDIEGLPFFEAIRQLGNDLPRGHVVFIHLTLLPFIPTAGELKTKPTQHSVKELRSIGVQPHILLCRCGSRRSRATSGASSDCSAMCGRDAVIEARDARSIYDVPRALSRGRPRPRSAGCIRHRACAKAQHDADGTAVSERATTIPKARFRIAVVGKYTGLKDAYKSLIEALNHGGMANKVRVKVHLDWIESGDLRERRTPRPRLEGGARHPRARRFRLSAARRARFSPPGFARATQACPISASALACRWRSSRRHARSPMSTAASQLDRVRPDARSRWSAS